VKMVLSGDGGDELFGGYNSYETTYNQLNSKMSLKKKMARLVARHGIFAKIRKEAFLGSLNFWERHCLDRECFHPYELPRLLRHHRAWKPQAGLPLTEFDPLTYCMRSDFSSYLVDDVLTKVDRMSMAHSLEVRVPLLDHRLVEWAFELPLEQKFKQKNGSLIRKHILKKRAGSFFTEEFLNRPKRGFGIPLNEWARGVFYKDIVSRLSDRGSPIFEFLNEAFVKSLLGEFVGGRRQGMGHIWYIYMFGLWMDKVHCSEQLPSSVGSHNLRPGDLSV